MRLIRVTAPENNAEAIKEAAFAVGIESISLQTAEKEAFRLGRNGVENRLGHPDLDAQG